MSYSYIKNVLENEFQEDTFKQFCSDIFKYMVAPSTTTISGARLPSDFQQYITKYVRLGKYTDPNGEVIDALVVYMSTDSSFNARTRQRNFARNYLRARNKQALLLAFVHPDQQEWRFSFVKLDYTAIVTGSGKVKDIEELTPAKRYSFLVGAHERSHTAQKQLSALIEQTDKPTLSQIESTFSISTVTNDFYEDYKHLYEKLTEAFRKSEVFSVNVSVTPEDFSKKLMGQIVFIYFLQKKGWLGVNHDASWGSGDRNYLETLLQECLDGGDPNKERNGKNFFNDYLEHLFYDTLNKRDRGNSSPTGDQSYSPYFNCRIPYLNGGLFEHVYEWRSTYIDIDNQVFKEIIDTFNKYNFTVHESTPLETEVAVDPEILGRVFEKLQILKEQKEKGAFYTPSNIVHYMSRKTIVQYLTDNSLLNKEELEKFIILKDEVFANKEQLIEIEKIIPNVARNALHLNQLLCKVKIIDPAVGSGAFPMGLLTEITGLRRFLNERYIKETNKRGKQLSEYDIKKQVLENSIYGVDLDDSAVEIARLRFWLSLVVEYNLEDIEPLPNLDYKLVKGDSLLKLPYINSPTLKSELEDIEALKDSYFEIDDIDKKNKAKRAISNVINRIYVGQEKNIGYKVSHDYRVAFSEVYQGDNPGFDIVIANPPYVSTKGIDKSYKNILKAKVQFGFADDLYYHFFIKGLEIAKNGGVLCYITSDTFLTTVSKRNLRRTLEDNELLEVIKTSNVFENAMVSPAITLVKKHINPKSYNVNVKDAIDDFDKPAVYTTNITTFREAVNNVIYLPTDYNMRLYNAFNSRVSDLMDIWWDRIKTSRDIEKNRTLIKRHIDNLKPGDLTLLGLITDGGQGLATANNGKFVGVVEGTKEAGKIHNISRAKKLIEAKYKNKPIFNFATKHEAQEFLNSKTEQEIWQLFDNTKEKYGRDVFGQGYLYRIVPKHLIADVSTLTEEEKAKGIASNKPTYVPYDKGDKDGNRWYLETPFVIDWSTHSVKELSTSPKSRFQNSQFYFKKGFCWTDVNSTYLKSRLKQNGVYDVLSMSMFSQTPIFSDQLAVTYINTKLISEYVAEFINNTQHFQINDARQLPIIIPDSNQSLKLNELFNKGVELRIKQDAGDVDAHIELLKLQNEVDYYIENLYLGANNG